MFGFCKEQVNGPLTKRGGSKLEYSHTPTATRSGKNSQDTRMSFHQQFCFPDAVSFQDWSGEKAKQTKNVTFENSFTSQYVKWLEFMQEDKRSSIRIDRKHLANVVI